MRRSTGGSRTLAAFSLVLAVVATVLAPLAGSGSDAASAEQNKAWKELSLLYLSDIKGKVEPCG